MKKDERRHNKSLHYCSYLHQPMIYPMGRYGEDISVISYGHGSVSSDFWYGDGPYYPNYYYGEYPFPYANYPYYPEYPPYPKR